MEKYVKIINLLVNNESDRFILIKQLEEIKTNPTNYFANSDRDISSSDYYMWLCLIDLLIAKQYAFEIDWKGNYDNVKHRVEALLNKWLIKFQIENDDKLYDLDAESYLPKINPLIKNTNCQIFNLDIDSDSYVTTMTNVFNEQSLLEQDKRIKKY